MLPLPFQATGLSSLKCKDHSLKSPSGRNINVFVVAIAQALIISSRADESYKLKVFRNL
jgi:hypothetical protein